jgi:tetratricopeptide (TPR) repeat protein
MRRLLAGVVLGVTACTPTPKIKWSPGDLRAELARRVPGVPPSELVVPFELDPKQEELVRRLSRYEQSHIRRAERLLESLRRSDELRLEYVPAETSTAKETLAARQGNCLSLASVVVGMARAVGLDAYFVDVSHRVEDVVRHGGFSVRSGHVLAVIRTRDGFAALDVAGRDLRAYGRWRAMSDLEATAHYYNNRGYELIYFSESRGLPVPWAHVYEHFRRATLILPGFARAHNNLGVAAMRLGRPLDAERHYLASLDHAPDLPSPYSNLGSLYLAQERFVEAEAALRRAFEIEETPVVAHRLGRALNELGRCDEAIEILARGARLGSEHASELLSRIVHDHSDTSCDHR